MIQAYQTGAGLMDMVSPTNGTMLAILLAARVGYRDWLRFTIPGLAPRWRRSRDQPARWSRANPDMRRNSSCTRFG